jgi:hypothetical protein
MVSFSPISVSYQFFGWNYQVRGSGGRHLQYRKGHSRPLIQGEKS